MDGVLNIDKSKGLTSNDVVKRVKRILCIKKAGHTGTLDPEATGVLPVLVGKATKISQYLINSDKEYSCKMELGVKTDTGDSAGMVISRYSGTFPSEIEICRTFKKFTGRILQIPPMYSAIKVNGRPLYSLARKGIEIERKAREVIIHNIEILSINGNSITFKVLCSKGTYIRTLVSDIGDILGVGGYLVSLRRTIAGKFRIEDSIDIKELEDSYKRGKIARGFYTIEEALENV